LRRGGQADLGYRSAALGVASFRVVPEVADEGACILDGHQTFLESTRRCRGRWLGSRAFTSSRMLSASTSGSLALVQTISRSRVGVSTAAPMVTCPDQSRPTP